MSLPIVVGFEILGNLAVAAVHAYGAIGKLLKLQSCRQKG